MAVKNLESSRTSNTEHLSLPLLRIDGTSAGETINLDPRVFGVERNDHVLYLAVKTEQKNSRQGNHATRNRSLVRGGGKKPFKQKGRGAARAGTIRSPLWKGGGKIFGPHPFVHTMKIPAKVRQLARRVALSAKALNGNISLVEDFDFDAPKSKRAADILKSLKFGTDSALILVAENRPNVYKSCRNIPRLEVREGMNASTQDILRARRLLITKSALTSLVGGLAGEE